MLTCSSWNLQIVSGFCLCLVSVLELWSVTIIHRMCQVSKISYNTLIRILTKLIIWYKLRKIYLFYNAVLLVNNIRNSLLNIDGLGLFQTPCCAEVWQNFFIQHGSSRRIKPFFRRARTSCDERLSKASCTPQHGFSTACKVKRCSADVIFLCRLQKFSLKKYFLVNWGIIIEYFHKHYIK